MGALPGFSIGGPATGADGPHRAPHRRGVFLIPRSGIPTCRNLGEGALAISSRLPLAHYRGPASSASEPASATPSLGDTCTHRLQCIVAYKP